MNNMKRELCENPQGKNRCEISLSANNSEKSKNGSRANVDFPECREGAAPDMTALSFCEKYNTRILLLRHGESLGNARRAYLGHTDADLSERGYQQAERTDLFLSSTHIDAIYSSDLQRAYHTALPHARRRGLDIVKREQLRELNLGAWENKNYDELAEGWPELFFNVWRKNFGCFAAPGGESVADCTERIYNEILRISRESVGKTVLVAFHAAAIRVLWGRVCGILLEELNDAVPFPENASLSVLYFDGNSLIPGEFSHSAHNNGI